MDQLDNHYEPPANYYFEIVVVGTGTLTKFHAKTTPPRVGDLMNLSHVSTLKGNHEVLQVKHTYYVEEHDGPVYMVEVQILLDANETPGRYWVTGK